MRCARGAKNRLFSTTGGHRSQGPEFCTPNAVLNGSCFCRGVVFRGVPRIHNVFIGGVRALCENAPIPMQVPTHTRVRAHTNTHTHTHTHTHTEGENTQSRKPQEVVRTAMGNGTSQAMHHKKQGMQAKVLSAGTVWDVEREGATKEGSAVARPVAAYRNKPDMVFGGRTGSAGRLSAEPVRPTNPCPVHSIKPPVAKVCPHCIPRQDVEPRGTHTHLV